MADIEAAKAEIDKHLRKEEGERLKPYLCKAKVPTIGVGATTYLDGRRVTLADPPITVDQMNRMLQVSIDRYVDTVAEMVNGVATTNQLIALVICAYNIGLDGLRRSTMIKRHVEGNYQAAARAFNLWNQSRPGGPGTPLEVDPVLVARRAREAAIYLTPDDGTDEPSGCPQAVEPESNPLRGGIAKATAVIVGAPVVELATDASEGIAALKPAVLALRDFVAGTLGVPTQYVVPILVAVAGVLVLRWRLKQRSEGWA